ncbi:NAD-dependent protein deacetylase hst2-1, partial [Podospora australis]
MASVDLTLEGVDHASGSAYRFAVDHKDPHPLQLYGSWFCPFVQRAWITLAEKKIPHQYVEINPYDKTKAFLALNPRGLVPTLAVPEGSKQRSRPPLYESTVICEYLDEEYSDPTKFGPSLLPSDDHYERARCRLWMNHIATKITPAWYRFLQHGNESRYSLEEAREEFGKHIKAFVREMLSRDREAGHEKGPWFLGSKFSLVDIYLVPWAKRIFVIDHYKKAGGGSGVPAKGTSGLSGEDKEIWERWWAWEDAMLERESIKMTCSSDDHYRKVYKRYAENTTQSEIGRKQGSGPRPRANQGRQQLDDFGEEDYSYGGHDDFRVQGKGSAKSFPKSKKKKGPQNRQQRVKMGQEQSMVDEDTPPLTLSDRTVDAVADLIRSGKARRIVVLTGAGISTAAGIPDFRSPETGLYANLAKLDLPEPEAVFDLSFFRQNPRPFYVLAKELYPGNYHPTVSHTFLSLLASKNLLHHLFTQNIDCLERAAGIPGDLIIEAHGSFATQRCIECKTPFDDAKMREHVSRGEVPRCEQPQCDGLVKPDIVFFGEQLPKAFFEKRDLVEDADLVLVLGTSLQVHPFAGLPNLAPERVPRVLFNMERVGSLGSQADDVLVLGDCDAGVRKLADALGWREELEKKWRELVGDEEAERQLQGAHKRVASLQNEVAKLAEEVDEILHLNESKAKREKDTDDQSESVPQDA